MPLHARSRSGRWLGLAALAGWWLIRGQLTHATTSLHLAPESGWQEDPTRGSWIWEHRFSPAQRIHAIHQKLGDHPFVLRRAPEHYRWEYTLDGQRWQPIRGATVRRERRLLRSFPVTSRMPWRGLRLEVVSSTDPGPPQLQSVRVDTEASGPAPRPPWILMVNSTHDPRLPGHGEEFLPLARSCPGWDGLEGQQVWVRDLDPELLTLEPRPLAIFLSGSFKDWCEVDRSDWRGVERILRRPRRLGVPMWASCGGAQALAILADRGTGRPWDCPHCRDPQRPKLPIYGHIGHRHPEADHRCGDYSDCVFERGPHWVRQEDGDPVFRGLPTEFLVMESHCGQIEFPPRGWTRVATAGQNTRTQNQCLRLAAYPIYAAQFHIEMAGTPEASRTIMANFLSLARELRQAELK